MVVHIFHCLKGGGEEQRSRAQTLKHETSIDINYSEKTYNVVSISCFVQSPYSVRQNVYVRAVLSMGIIE